MATKPRQILPGRTWFITGRAVWRQHRFVPEKKIVATLWYCLAVAAHKYEVELHGFVWMSNHYHLVLTDRHAELPDFMRDLNSLISKAMNAVRGVRGENFERRGYNAVVVADGARLLRHCAYAEANPCRANLVERALDWESVTSASMEYGEEKVVRRPDFGLWSQAKAGDKGRMDPKRAEFCGRIACPEEASFRLVRPPCLNGDDNTKTRAQVRKLVAELEEETRKLRASLGQEVMGMRRVRRVKYTASPSEREGFFGKVPEVSGDDREEREAVEWSLREFLARYRTALDEYRKTGIGLFPNGTWWMRRCLRKRCYAYCESG